SLQLTTCELHRRIRIKVAAAANLHDERAQIGGAQSTLDDLTFADLPLGGPIPQQRGDLGIKVNRDTLATAHAPIVALARFSGIFGPLHGKGVNERTRGRRATNRMLFGV